MDRSNENSESLNKYIASTGRCSRREADVLIKAGKVTLNGVVAQAGNRVFAGDTVLIEGQPLQAKPKPVYIIFNKPKGVVCTTDKREKDNIIDYINYHERLFPIGRLDKPSEGVIFLTNDGDIVNKILRAGNQHEKEYIVTVKQPISKKFLADMSKGVPILGTVTKRCVLEQINKFTFRIILVQGLNRQIRRMCEYFNYDVLALQRVRVMNIKLGKLPSGQWREFSKVELDILKASVQNSSKVSAAQASKKRNKS
jgi:23S rRNA pseudouridine2604 synthase